MSIKSQVQSIASGFTGQVDHLPERAEDARKAVNEMTRDMTARAVAMVRQHPGRSIIGAFIIGYAIAKVAKHA